MKRIVPGLALFLSLNSFAGELGSWKQIQGTVALRYPEIPAGALTRAFDYLSENPERIGNQDYLTIIDFNRPSTEERMFVIDLHTSEAKTYLVAHGKNSGENYAERFSNTPGSLMSSLGIYLTGASYIGEHGLSMKLHGQEATNSNAEMRAIVLHPAAYVSHDFIQANGRLGRSWGCPAVSPEVSEDLIRKLQSGSVFLIYRDLSAE